MSDDEIQLEAQSILQEFDDARELPDADTTSLGRKAVAALDAFIEHWRDKPFMQPHAPAPPEEEPVDLQKYAERQIEWATIERERVLKLLPGQP